MKKNITIVSIVSIIAFNANADFGDSQQTQRETKKFNIEKYNPNLVKKEIRLNKFRFTDFGEIKSIEPVYENEYYEIPDKKCQYDRFVEVDPESGLKMLKDKKHCEDVPKKVVKRHIKGYKIKFKYTYDGFIYTNTKPQSTKIKVRMEIDADKSVN